MLLLSQRVSHTVPSLHWTLWYTTVFRARIATGSTSSGNDNALQLHEREPISSRSLGSMHLRDPKTSTRDFWNGYWDVLPIRSTPVRTSSSVVDVILLLTDPVQFQKGVRQPCFVRTTRRYCDRPPITKSNDPKHTSFVRLESSLECAALTLAGIYLLRALNSKTRCRMQVSRICPTGFRCIPMSISTTPSLLQIGTVQSHHITQEL